MMWNTGILKQAVTHYLKQKRKSLSHLQLSVESMLSCITINYYMYVSETNILRQ